MADTFITNMVWIAEDFIRGYCFYRLMKPFMKRAVCAGLAYFLIMMLLYIVPFHMNYYAAYVIGSFIVFGLVCLTDRRNYRQKAFLVAMFSSMNWLSMTMAEILYDNLYAFAENTDYMKSHTEIMWIALYAGVCMVYLLLEFSFMIIGVRQVLKTYRNKSVDMTAKELIMLLIPSLMGMIAYRIIRNYRMFYLLEGGENRVLYDVLIVLFCAVSIISIVVVIVLYQDIKAKQEENRQAESLAIQIGNIRRHIGQVEDLYQGIRGVRHDMTNHILTLELSLIHI